MKSVTCFPSVSKFKSLTRVLEFCYRIKMEDCRAPNSDVDTYDSIFICDSKNVEEKVQRRNFAQIVFPETDGSHAFKNKRNGEF